MNLRNSSRAGIRRAFTLVEMLAVISIIALMAGLFGYVFIGGGTAVMPAAQRSLSSMVNFARITAMQERTTAYFIIYRGSTGGTDPEKYLKYMGVVYEEKDELGEPTGNFFPANEGAYLPGDIFFIPSDLGTNDTMRSVQISQQDLKNFSFPEFGGEESEWYAVGFDDRGQTLPEARSPVLVLRPAQVIGIESGRPDFDFTDSEFQAVAVYVRPTGLTMVAKDFEEIEALTRETSRN